MNENNEGNALRNERDELPLEIFELNLNDIDEIRALEEKAFVPGLQASKDTIENRLRLGHIILGLKSEGELIGQISFSYSNFSPNHPEEFPQDFATFSSRPRSKKYNAAFVYNLGIDPAYRGLLYAKKLIEAAIQRAIQDGCRYGVADVRISSYNGSIGFEQEERKANPIVKSTINKYADSERSLVSINPVDYSNLYHDPTMNLYHRLVGLKPLWVARNFIPQDLSTGGFRVIGYVDYQERKENNITLSKEWSIVSESLYGEEFIGELAGLLKENNAQTVLECGCGNGHILEGLARQGFQCLGIDSDPEMITMAQEKTGDNLEFKQMDWLELDEITESFDAVICRGNSLTYVNSWGRNLGNPEETKAAMMRSLSLMFAKVKPGGILYVDTTSQEEIDQNGGRVEFQYGENYLHGKIDYDWQKRIRKVSGNGLIEGKKFEGESECYLITPQELTMMLEELKPTRIWSPQLEHEKNYQIICVRK